MKDCILILNHKSFQFDTKEEINPAFKHFFSELYKGKVQKFKYCSLYYYNGIMRENLLASSTESYSIQENLDLKKLFLSMITKQGINFSDNSFTEFNSKETSLLSLSHYAQYKKEALCIDSKTMNNIYNASSFDNVMKKILLPYALKQIIVNELHVVEACGFNLASFNKLIFHDDFFENFKQIAPDIQKTFYKLLIALIMGENSIADLHGYSDESKTVKRNKSMNKSRLYRFNYCQKDSKQIYKHFKFRSGFRLYCEKIDDGLYFGYFGTHLITKKYSS